MIHIYTGEGKGKTTAAYGLCLRARGWNKKACVIQFLKSGDFTYGETVSAKKAGIKIVCLNQKHPLFCSYLKAPQYSLKLKKDISASLSSVRDIVSSGKFDLIVLDEIINALDQKYLTESQVLSLLGGVPGRTELVLTGRGKISRRLSGRADYITHMREVKHPFKKKMLGRRGIEF